MTENIKKLQEYLAELKQEKAVYTKTLKEGNPEFFGIAGNKDRKPEIVEDSSFLYIRSYVGDIGDRPFSGIAAWNSPDINISPVTDIGNFGTTLHAGNSYNINVTLHNRGDITVPFPKVELFLTTPSLGFDTRFADLIGLTQYPGLLLSGGTDSLDYVYNVPVDLSGHRCLFARTYSFSPLDKPFDPYALQPHLDRHIAQKNLNFVAQNSEYQFNLIHLPNTQEQIMFVPLTRQKVLELMHPGVLQFKIADQIPRDALAKLEVMPLNKTPRGFQIKNNGRGVDVMGAGGKGWDVKEQAALMKQLKALSNPKRRADTETRKKVYRAFRAMNEHLTRTELTMKIPDFGLQPGQLAGLNIVNTNQVTGEVKGGITLLITG